MKDFLLEILSEEIPAKMQKDAAKNFAQISFEAFTKAGLSLQQNQVKTLISPRRITLYIENLAPQQKVAAIKKIGPKISADKKAIEGFLKSNNLKNENELEKIEHNNSLCYLFTKPESATKTSEIIQQNLEIILQKMTNSWPKLMRFDIDEKGNQARWIRPVRNILCIFGAEIINFNYFGLKANNLTYGHFLHSSKPLKIADANQYEEILRKNFVIVDQDKRKKEIIAQIEKIAHKNNLETIDDKEKSPLFDEVTGLCEWPLAMLGNINEKFMNLPKEILILTLKLNQKYFCLQDFERNISQKFIFISNSVNSLKNNEKIIKDNEKVVKARLEDAKFFVDEDLKTPLESRISGLKNIIFHQKLGSLYERCERVEELAEFLSIWVPHCDISLIERCAYLCKADLLTKAVGELPELQGRIGNFYAKQQGENPKITAAIYEHYLPLGPTSDIPATPLGVTLAIADKTDAIVGLFLAGEKPTSSKDPFALRRMALGVIRICLTHNIQIPFRVLINKSLKNYKPKLIDALLSANDKSIKKEELTEEIIKFFFERLKHFLKENENINADVLNAVIDDYINNIGNHKYGDMIYLAKKVKYVNKLVRNSENSDLLKLYKRCANVLAIEEKKDGRKYEGKPHKLTFKTDQEKVLYKMIKKINPDFRSFIKKGNFAEAFRLLKMLEIPLTHFFELVIVNDKKAKLRENRLLLLSTIRAMFISVADLSKIEI